jgi:NADH-quinone oxidoreductase subunit G
LAQRALAGAVRVVAVDAFLTESSRHADVVLAAAAFGEKDGTTTNIEGRVTRVRRKVTPAGTARPDWAIAVDLADRLGTDLLVDSVRQVWDELVAVSPAHATLDAAALEANPDGLVADGSASEFPISDSGAAAPHPNAYDFRLVASRILYDAAIGTAQSPSLAPLARGARLHINPWDHDRLGATAPVKVVTPRTSVVLEAVADDGVPRGAAWIAVNQPNVAVAELIDASAPVIDIRVEVLS